MPNIWIILVVAVSSLIKGLTGSGFALISLPILLFWYAPKEIIPVLMICNLLASVFIILQKKEYNLISKQSRWLIATGGVFTLAGVLVLNSANETILVHFAGIFFMLLIVLSLLRHKIAKRNLPQHIYMVVGAVIGFITGTISVSGPPLALFLNRAKVSNREFREIFAWFSVVTATVAITGYFHTGLLTSQVIKTSLLFVPILLLGSLIGKHLNTVIPIQRFRGINITLAIISSILLILS